jgi:hypothetical protein
MQKKLELAKIKIMDKSKKKVIKGRSLFDYKYISLHSKEDKKKKEIEEQNRIKNNSNDINIIKIYCILLFINVWIKNIKTKIICFKKYNDNIRKWRTYRRNFNNVTKIKF